MAENKQENHKKYFWKTVKANSNKALTLFILDMLIAQWAGDKLPLSVFSIRREIHQRKGFWLEHEAVYGIINCIADMDNINLHAKKIRAGKSRAQAFYITFKSEELA